MQNSLTKQFQSNENYLIETRKNIDQLVNVIGRIQEGQVLQRKKIESLNKKINDFESADIQNKIEELVKQENNIPKKWIITHMGNNHDKIPQPKGREQNPIDFFIFFMRLKIL